MRDGSLAQWASKPKEILYSATIRGWCDLKQLKAHFEDSRRVADHAGVGRGMSRPLIVLPVEAAVQAMQKIVDNRPMTIDTFASVPSIAATDKAEQHAVLPCA